MQWFTNLLAPFLDWIQVEVTSHCNAQCTYCPHAVFGEFWQNRHMPLDLYRKLSRAFRRTSLVYLQGWGEPLLHPQFFRNGSPCTTERLPGRNHHQRHACGG